MKKLIKIVVAALAVLTLCVGSAIFVACDNKNEDKKILVAMPDGAPALALAQLMGEVSNLSNYDITYAIKDGTSIRSVVMSGEADIALLPMNIAAALYNGGIDIRLVSANIYGLLYLVGSEALDNGLQSLIGKVVY
ncbi:MAG: hypothetical protein EOM87_07980, partial [Clostridia bacterium]|nr:hypothetical protein [Clostridia bacterium]